MPQYVPIKGIKQLEDALAVHGKRKCLIYMYFFGQKDSKGQSWCPDCVAAEDGVQTAFREYAHPNSLIYSVDVGDRETWKDKSSNNKFRAPPYNLTVIPSLLRWNSFERLDGDQLLKADLLKLFFDEAKSEGIVEETVPCT